jgi:hypothetical protein
MHRHFTRAFCAAAAAFTLTTAGPAGAALAAPSAMAAPFSGRLYGAAATSASDVWAVGPDPSGMLIQHRNGTVWTQTVTPALGFLISVAAPSASDAWTAGGTGWFGSQTLIEHW